MLGSAVMATAATGGGGPRTKVDGDGVHRPVAARCRQRRRGGQLAWAVMVVGGCQQLMLLLLHVATVCCLPLLLCACPCCCPGWNGLVQPGIV